MRPNKNVNHCLQKLSHFGDTCSDQGQIKVAGVGMRKCCKLTISVWGKGHRSIARHAFVIFRTIGESCVLLTHACECSSN